MINRVVEEIKSRGIEAEARTVSKNGVKKQGIILGGGRTRAVWYIDNEETQDVEYLADKAIEIYRENYKESFDIERLKAWEHSKDKLSLCVCGKGKEDNAITMPYLDLNLYVRVSANESASAVVNEELLSVWGVEKEELFITAIKNTLPTIRAFDLIDLFSLERKSITDIEFNHRGLYGIGNKREAYGASAIYYRGLLSKIADNMGTDLYIMPSSIHEILVMSVTNAPAEDVKKMVRDTNDSEVSEEDILSYSVYRFKKDTCEIEVL